MALNAITRGITYRFFIAGAAQVGVLGTDPLVGDGWDALVAVVLQDVAHVAVLAGANVALMWMINQAGSQTIKFETGLIEEQAWDTVSNPILHDKSANQYDLGEVAQTRDIVYGNGASSTRVPLTAATIDGKNAASTRPVVDYFPNPYPCKNYEVGFVDMKNTQTG